MPDTPLPLWARFRPLALLACLAGLLLLSPSALADTLIQNVSGVTLDENGRPQPFKAMLINPDGTIRAIYRGKDKVPSKVQIKVDGRGQTLLPGMIDSHVHLMAIGFADLTLDLSETRSLAEAQAAIARFAAQHPDRAWIIGRGWNQERWGLGRFPTAADLEGLARGRPIWLTRVDGHAGWGNREALAAAGVTAATKDPVGGRIERGPGGVPNGVLIDSATALVDRLVPPPRPADRDLALSRAQQLLMAKGITAVADMGTSIEDWQTLRRAGDANRLAIRVMAYADGIDAMSFIAGPEPTPWLYEDRLRLNGVKLYLDGALGSRGAWLKSPYSDAPGSTGLRQLSDAQLRNLMSRAAMDRFQVAVHAIGDAANEAVLDAIEELSLTYKGDRRWRIEHAQVVDPNDLPRFGRNGTVASMQPSHQTSDRTMAEARLGPNRLGGAYAWRGIGQAGAIVAFGSDAPVEPADPFEGMAVAISRTDAAGQPAGGWQAQHAVDRIAALDGFTRNAARAGFAETRFGRLALGMRADFILVDVDPLTASPAQIRNTKVLQTWIAGAKQFDLQGEPSRQNGR